MSFRKRKSDGQAFPVGKGGIKANNPSNDVGGIKIGNGIKIPKNNINSDNQLENMFELKKKEITKEREDSELKDFTFNALNSSLNWGFGDVGSAVDKATSVDVSGSELSDLIQEFHDDTETPFEDIDVVSVIYDHILQNARNEIDSVLGFDIQNDADFEVAGNFLATTYNHSTESLDDLREKFRNASQTELDQLKNNVFVKSFVTDIDLFF